ncbi:unnamed protein product [Trifolium pratense]|uniref:Uncharacterized protein n=1 Tax=Trifolium pratense TaxID=57577 RepID=A0ACB0KHN1_TRIPR|nr:unnamed protein product [Trifolium pratense]
MIEVADDDFYLPDECWELVFKFLIKYDYEENNHNHCFKSLSLVSKQFLSITNRLRYSLIIKSLTGPYLPSLFRRFPNLTSLSISSEYLDNLLCQISTFSLNVTWLHLRNVFPFPTNGLRAFSQNITPLTSLICSHAWLLNTADMFLIADCFPNLKLLDLNRCLDLCEVGTNYVLRRCCNIEYLSLAYCMGLKISEINFELPKLKMLNLTYTKVDDEILYVISKGCHGLLKLLLSNCYYITENGVKHVAENCTKLGEINLSSCDRVHGNIVRSMISIRPSLKKITAPPSFPFSKKNGRPILYHGCIIVTPHRRV